MLQAETDKRALLGRERACNGAKELRDQQQFTSIIITRHFSSDIGAVLL